MRRLTIRIIKLIKINITIKLINRRRITIIIIIRKTIIRLIIIRITRRQIRGIIRILIIRK